MPVGFAFEEAESPQRKRRNSDPEVQFASEGAAAAEPLVKRSARKMQTFAAPTTQNSRRAETKLLSGEALAELHHLNEKWLKKERKNMDNTTESAMKAAWQECESRGAWLAYGECPPLKEKPFHTRACKYYPGGEASKAAFAQWNGAFLNTKGRKSATDTNPGQDNFSVSRLPEDWQVVCCMDGHGPNGHWPSTRAVQTMPFFLQGGAGYTMLKQGQVSAALINAFRKVEADLEYQAFKENVDIQVAGCTAVCCCYQPNQGTVWVATAGDSRVILVEPGKGAVAETKDHKPSSPDEKKRVEEMGCDVQITTYEDGWVEERINIAGRDYPGISMTRCLGDLLVKDYGVIAEPEVVEWRLDGYKDPYLFAASDGVWEFLETDEVATMLLDSLAAGETMQEACKKVLKKSREAWQDNEGNYCDDITMVFMPLQGVGRLKEDAPAGGGCCGGILKLFGL